MSTQTIKGYLDHVEIRGFRSLKDVSVDLSPLTVLIGANGAGKSNFIKFFELMRWLADRGSLNKWVVQSGGADDQLFMGSRVTNQIFLELVFKSATLQGEYKYQASLVTTQDEKLVFDFEKIQKSAPDQKNNINDEFSHSTDQSRLPYLSEISVSGQGTLFADEDASGKSILHLLQGCKVYQFHDTSRHANIKKHHDVTDSVYLNADGSNLAAVLLSLKENELQYLQLIENHIRRVLPAFDGFVLEPVNGKVMLRWRHKDSEKVMGAHLTSDGSLRLFCLITLFNLPDSRLPDVILLDEPELGLHPYAIQLLAAMMKSASKRSQIIASTQSVTLANELDWQDIVVVQYEDNASNFVRLDEEALEPWLDQYAIGDIWQKNLIGGTPAC